MARNQRPDNWRGRRVLVVHPIQQSGVQSVGNTSGTLEELGDRGITLLVEDGHGKELHFFPWTSIIKIILEEGEEENPAPSFQIGR